MERVLIAYIGNPVVKDDNIGILIGERLQAELAIPATVAIREFSHAPLDLVAELGPFRRVLLVDAIITGQHPAGTVRFLDGSELLSPVPNHFPHGMGLAEVIATARELQTPLPDEIKVIGIEIPCAEEFGEGLSDVLQERYEDIYRQVKQLTASFLNHG